jgi:hypothetical protein
MLSKYVDSLTDERATSQLTDTPEPFTKNKLLYRTPAPYHSSTPPPKAWHTLRALSSETAGQLHILGHDRDTLAVNGTKIGI